jgi:hypothetical protein
MSLFDFSTVIYMETHGINNSFYVPIIIIGLDFLLLNKLLTLGALVTAACIASRVSVSSNYSLISGTGQHNLTSRLND